MRLNKLLIGVIGLVLVLTLAWHSRVNAEAVGVQQPAVLEKAERALGRDEPSHGPCAATWQWPSGCSGRNC